MAFDADLIPAGLVRCDADARIVSANARMRGWMEAEDGAALEGRPFWRLLTPAGRIYFETHLRPMLAVEGRCDEISLELRAPSGARRPVFLNGHAERDADGAVTAIHFACFDGTHRRDYEAELMARRRKAEAFEALVEASPDAIVTVSTEMKVQSWNRAAERLLGFSAGEMVGGPVHPRVIPDDRFDEARAANREAEGGRSVRIETERLHRDGTRIPVELNIARIKDERGEVVGTAGVLRDIRERKRTEALIGTLNREIVHRAKNLMTVVQAVAGMTARRTDPAAFMEVFSARLASMGRNLTLLVERNWEDVDLSRLIRGQLSHLGDGLTARVRIGGPEVTLSAAAAEALGMAVFELSTNAVKYGALSRPEGRLSVTWTVEDAAEGERLRLVWAETGVTGVVPPATRGFGSDLTGPLLERATRGTARADYRPDGLRWTFEAGVAGL